MKTNAPTFFIMPSVNKQTCPTCRQSVNERQITLFTGMVVALWKVYQFCDVRQTNTFARKEVKHLFTDENMTARFADWLWFDPNLIRRDGRKKGCYELNMTRAADFFAGLAAAYINQNSPGLLARRVPGDENKRADIFYYAISK